MSYYSNEEDRAEYERKQLEHQAWLLQKEMEDNAYKLQQEVKRNIYNSRCTITENGVTRKMDFSDWLGVGFGLAVAVWLLTL